MSELTDALNAIAGLKSYVKNWKERALSAEGKLANIGKLDRWNPKYVETFRDSGTPDDKITWVVKADDIDKITG